MSFEPSGGFPPLMRKSQKQIKEEELSTRAFPSTNFVNISDIINKKKDVPFFSPETEDGYNVTDSVFYQKPEEYENIEELDEK